MKGLESFGVTGELQTDKETGPIDVAQDVAAERKATTIIRQTPKKSSQSNAYVERAHQSVEAMVRTMKEVIEDKAHTRLSATDNITSWMIRHAAFLQTRFSVPGIWLGRATTLSEPRRVSTQQGRFERRMMKKSGTVASSRV